MTCSIRDPNSDTYLKEDVAVVEGFVEGLCATHEATRRHNPKSVGAGRDGAADSRQHCSNRCGVRKRSKGR